MKLFGYYLIANYWCSIVMITWLAPFFADSSTNPQKMNYTYVAQYSVWCQQKLMGGLFLALSPVVHSMFNWPSCPRGPPPRLHWSPQTWHHQPTGCVNYCALRNQSNVPYCLLLVHQVNWHASHYLLWMRTQSGCVEVMLLPCAIRSAV